MELKQPSGSELVVKWARQLCCQDQVRLLLLGTRVSLFHSQQQRSRRIFLSLLCGALSVSRTHTLAAAVDTNGRGPFVVTDSFFLDQGLSLRQPTTKETASIFLFIVRHSHGLCDSPSLSLSQQMGATQLHLYSEPMSVFQRH